MEQGTIRGVTQTEQIGREALAERAGLKLPESVRVRVAEFPGADLERIIGFLEDQGHKKHAPVAREESEESAGVVGEPAVA